MEGAGVYVACHDHKVDWIVVKGICDWGDGDKSKNKRLRQKKAARSAAEFLMHCLQRVQMTALLDDGLTRAGRRSAKAKSGQVRASEPTTSVTPAEQPNVSQEAAFNLVPLARSLKVATARFKFGVLERRRRTCNDRAPGAVSHSKAQNHKKEQPREPSYEASSPLYSGITTTARYGGPLGRFR
jgi:hypothetical protein